MRESHDAIHLDSLRPHPTGFGDDEQTTAPRAFTHDRLRTQRPANDDLDETTLDEPFVDDEAPTEPRGRRCLTPL